MLVNKQLAAVIAAGLVLGGCSALQGNKLGETKVEVDFQGNVVERIDSAGELATQLNKAGLSAEEVKIVLTTITRPLPKTMTFRDGKDKASEKWTVDIAEGKTQYQASEIDAATVAGVKADISEAIGDDLTKQLENAFPDGIAGLIEKIKGL